MGSMSRRKGKVGEREWRDQLRAQGFEANRGQQFSGSCESPDVVCHSLPSVHFEVKRVEGGTNKVYDWVAQAQEDADGKKLPVVAHRQNNREWLVVMPAETFFQIIRQSALIAGRIVVDSTTEADSSLPAQPKETAQ
jgi:Holliday junction resolvase